MTWTNVTPTNLLPNSYETELVSPWPTGYGACPAATPHLSASRISNIKLPNNLSYQFQYDPQSGLLSKMYYPNGGYIRYVWEPNTKSDYGILTAPGDTSHNPDCEEQYDTYALRNRYVSFDGTNEVLEQDFSYSTNWVTCPYPGAVCVGGSLQQSWSYKKTTVTTIVRTVSNGSLQSLGSFQTVYTYSPIAVPAQPNDGVWYGGSATPVESEVDYYDFSGTKLRTVQKTYVDPQLPPNEVVTLDNGQVSQTTYTYQNQFSNPSNPLGCDITCLAVQTDEYNYDYGSGSSGPVLKHTHTDYATFGNTPIFSAGPSIVDSPSDVIIFDGNSNKMAETDYAYDQTAVSPQVATQHDDTRYPSGSGLIRGNATTKAVKCLQTGCSNSVSTFAYDQTGQVTSRLDPCGNGTCSDMTGSGHTTSYFYTDAYTTLNTSNGTNQAYTVTGNPTSAYLTKITDALGHSTSFTYDYNTGELTSVVDSNTRTTGYIYNDLLSRPTQVNYPDGGQINNVYNDAAATVTTCQLITGTAGAACSASTPPSGWKVSLSSMDGAGHVLTNELVTDPDGATYSTVVYDGLGKTYRSYNPTRCSPATTNCGTEPTWGYTTYTYDSLGRATSVAEPDGSGTTTTYTGNQTNVIDEAGNQRTSQSDGLGRLTSVWEAPNATGYNYESDYQYDALNNLICAVQKGTDTTAFTNCASAPAIWRPRAFQYDSLSRLTSAANPESGTITYSYDLNGNLSNKVSPLPNVTTGSSTVTVNYTYDGVNRVTKKTYTGMTTPPMTTVQYGYDAGSLSGCAPAPPALTDSNPIGRRTSMCDGSGATSWAHDSMGRVLNEKRKLGPS